MNHHQPTADELVGEIAQLIERKRVRVSRVVNLNGSWSKVWFAAQITEREAWICCREGRISVSLFKMIISVFILVCESSL